MQEVLDRTAGKVRLWPATLYGTFKRLMDADLIEESDARPRARNWTMRAGDTTGLPAFGRQVLAAESERLEDLVRVIRSKRGLKPREAES